MTSRVRLKDIRLPDPGSSISYPLIDDGLFDSIKAVGVVEPVVLAGTPPYSIVSGARRVKAAGKLGIKEIPAVISEDLSEKNRLLYAVHSNLGRGLNTVEKAHVLRQAVRTGLDSDEIRRIMVLIALSPHDKILSTYLSIAESDETTKTFIITRNLSMKSIDYLMKFDPGERKRIIKGLIPMYLTESLIREILEMLHLLKIKKGVPGDKYLKKAENSQDLKVRMKKQLNPKLTSLEKRLKTIRKAMALPPNMDIRVDPFFEKEYIDIVIRAKDEQQVMASLTRLTQIIAKGQVGSVLELTKGRLR